MLLTRTPTTEAEYAAKTAQERIQRDGGSVAVLYRTNAQARPMEASFKREKIPYRIAGGESFYESREVLDSLSCISVATDPHRDDEATRRFVEMVPNERISKVAMRQIENSGMSGESFYDKLETAAADGSLNPRDERIVTKRIATIEALGKMADKPPSTMIQEGLQQTGYRDALSKSDDKRRMDKLDNIEELISDAHEFMMDERERDELYTPSNAEIGQRFVNHCAEIRQAAHEQEQEGHCVTLSTLHAAKGLEFDTVVFAGFDSERMPHHRSVNEAENRASAVEEERRLAYVGMTRARTELHLTVPLQIVKGGKPKRVGRSEFINDIPEELIEYTSPDKPQTRPPAAGDTHPDHERSHTHEYAAASR